MARPIALLGAERTAEMKSTNAPPFWFDGDAGLWRDKEGGLRVWASPFNRTLITATREGLDQSELSDLRAS